MTVEYTKVSERSEQLISPRSDALDTNKSFVIEEGEQVPLNTLIFSIFVLLLPDKQILSRFKER